MSTFKVQYEKELSKQIMQAFGFTNPMQLPRLNKIVINVGLSEALKNAQAIEKTLEDISMITGQRPVVSKAKKSISNFSLREGDKIGVYVTLRGDKMWDFLYRLIHIVLPRMKDFRGVSKKSFDYSGNYSLGMREQLVFPEIDSANIDKIRGMEISVVIKNSTPEKSLKFLEVLGMPFEKKH
jgi:large subunit ribosomal protein L5